jgi:hypothetical protein
MGTVNVLTAERALELAAAAVVGGVIDTNDDLILTTQSGATINAGNVGTVVDTSGLRQQSNANIPFDGGDPNAVVETVTITNDGTATTGWINRLVYKYLGVIGGVARKTFYLNEYGELRVAPAKSTTTAARFYVKDDPTNPPEARDATVPVVELMDDPVNRNSLRGWLGDGTTTRKGIKMGDLLVLGPTDAIPVGTPAGTLILRSSTPFALNLNPDFETNASNWTAAGGTLTRDTTQHNTGVASGKLVATGSVATSMTSEKDAITAGNTYKTDGYLRASIATTVNFNVTWYTAANAVVSTSTGSMSVTANTWSHISNSFVAPATATQASIVLSLSGTPAAGVTLWADDVTLSV